MQPIQPIAVCGEQLLIEAEALSNRLTESNATLNQWMECAKKGRMAWIQGLAYAVEQMKAELD
jgi:hypothetical protein